MCISIGTHSQNIQVYDRSTLKHHCTLNGHIGIVTNLRVTESPHGVYMFSASSDTTVQVPFLPLFLSPPSLSFSLSLSLPSPFMFPIQLHTHTHTLHVSLYIDLGMES